MVSNNKKLELGMTQSTELLKIYTDVFGGDLLRYVLGAGGTYLFINVLLSKALASQKIRTSDPSRAQILREIIASLRTVLVFAAAGTSISLGAKAGFMTIYMEIADYGWIYFGFSIGALIILHDAWFYWTHRILHYPPLFRRFHRLHHRSHQPTPFTSYSFDTGEAVVNAIYLPLVLLLLPAHPLALFIFVSHMMLRNAIGHCGIEIFPADSNGRPIFVWLTSVTHHDLHHSSAGYNLGLYFSWWDKLMKTEHPQYLETFAKVAPRRSIRSLKYGLTFLAVFSLCAATQAEAFELSGSYASPGLNTIVRIENCGENKQAKCGRLVWVWSRKNTPYARVGELVLENLVLRDKEWQGVLRDPETGRSFRGSIKRVSKNQLLLEGCAGILCGSQTWYSTYYLKRLLSGRAN